MEWLVVILVCLLYCLGFFHGGKHVLKKLSKTTYYPYSARSEKTSTQEFDADNPERLQNRLDEQSRGIDRLRKKLPIYRQSQDRLQDQWEQWCNE